MEFRPCIDIHNGKVKQIVGSSLKDRGNFAKENFVSDRDAAYFAKIYQKDGLSGGHIILLNPKGTPEYEKSKQQALLALGAYPGGMQVGGGMDEENCVEFLNRGASHIIVTSYVYRDGKINFGNLQKLVNRIGKKHLVLDLSCRKKEGRYFIVTDRWQKFTEEEVTAGMLERLSAYADEFLIHAVDVEGKASGIESELAELLGSWNGIPITYAGGVGNFEDLEDLKKYGQGHLNVTIGSALDLFGGKMPYEKVLEFCKKRSIEK